MKIVLALAASVSIAAGAAQGAAAGKGQVYKNDTRTCQVTVPSDWTVSDISATAPDKRMSLILVHEQDFKTEPMDPDMLKMVMRPQKVFENSSQRIFVEREAVAFGADPARAVWVAYVPAKPKGSCHLSITLKEGASEELAKAIVMSLGPAQ